MIAYCTERTIVYICYCTCTICSTIILNDCYILPCFSCFFFRRLPLRSYYSEFCYQFQKRCNQRKSKPISCGPSFLLLLANQNMPLSRFSDADDSVDILVSTIPKADNIDDHNAIIQRLSLYSFNSYTPLSRSNIHKSINLLFRSRQQNSLFTFRTDDEYKYYRRIYKQTRKKELSTNCYSLIIFDKRLMYTY